MTIAWLLERMGEFGADPALVWHDRPHSYAWLIAQVAAERELLAGQGVGAGSVLALHCTYSPRAVALLLALWELGGIAIPLASAAPAEAEEFCAIGEAEWLGRLSGDPESLTLESTGVAADHAHYRELRTRQRPGLVLFSSGSTGKSKGVVHDLVKLLAKFQLRKQKLRTLTFLLLDHIGGINTLLYTLSNGGVVVTARDATPDGVAEAVARHRVDLLPTSPTFLNLLLLSGAASRHDLGGLKLITYGTEPMPASTLERMGAAFPQAKLQQTYGLSELGILRSKSQGNGSLWVRIGGEGVETRVVDGQLHIRTDSAMLGYLNAPSPFDDEGWMNTGDEVEQDGELFLIKGRRSEIINVGGQKVYPAEVESVLATMENVRDVTVSGEPHPIMGQVVRCRVNLVSPEEPRAFRARLRAFCGERLASYKVPVRIEITDAVQYNARHKRIRNKPE